MHTILKAAVIGTTLGLVSTGFALEKSAATQPASTQAATTTPAAPTSDQVLTGSATNTPSQTKGQPTALTQDPGHDEDMD